MKLRIEGTPEELRHKSTELLKALATELGPHAPGVSELLKAAAAIPDTPLSRHAPLRELQALMHERYARGLAAMIEEVGDVVAEHLTDTSEIQKSLADTSLADTSLADTSEIQKSKVAAELVARGYATPDLFLAGGKLHDLSVDALQLILARRKL